MRFGRAGLQSRGDPACRAGLSGWTEHVTLAAWLLARVSGGPPRAPKAEIGFCLRQENELVSFFL